MISAAGRGRVMPHGSPSGAIARIERPNRAHPDPLDRSAGGPALDLQRRLPRSPASAHRRQHTVRTQSSRSPVRPCQWPASRPPRTHGALHPRPLLQACSTRSGLPRRPSKEGNRSALAVITATARPGCCRERPRGPSSFLSPIRAPVAVSLLTCTLYSHRQSPSRQRRRPTGLVATSAQARSMH